MTKKGVRLDASDWENLALKNACALVFSGRRALDAAARRFPGVCPELPRGFPEASQRLPRGFPEASRSRQSTKIWLQKAPGQDLAQNAHFPIIPEGAVTCRPGRLQIAKIWLQRAPPLAENGRCPMVTEGAFTCRRGRPQIAKLWLQKAPQIATSWLQKAANRSNQFSRPRVGTRMRSSMVGYPSAFLEAFLKTTTNIRGEKKIRWNPPKGST